MVTIFILHLAIPALTDILLIALCVSDRSMDCVLISALMDQWFQLASAQEGNATLSSSNVRFKDIYMLKRIKYNNKKTLLSM